MPATYLGIDCGTQGTKALVVDADGNMLGRGYAPHALIERSSGAREQDPQWWIAAATTAIRAALTTANAQDVRAIGVSGQQHGLVLLDEQHQVIRPAKLWNDTETAPQNAELVAHFGGEDAWRARFGIIPRTGYTVSKLLWLAQNEPANFARIRHILLPHDYLNFWLTGQLVAEAGDASGTGFFDPRTRQWLPEVLAFLDNNSGQLAAALPRLIDITQAAGTLRPELAEQFGLATACLVAAGGGDNMMGAIGTGNVREGIVTMSLGTSGTVYGFRNAPSQDTTGWIAPFCSSTGGWLPLLCTLNATNVTTQTATLLGKKVADIDAALTATPPGAEGLMLLPFFNGERTPDLPTAQGSLVGINANNFTRDHLIRAAVEGVTFGILEGVALITDNADRIRLIGGGARSRAWRQLIADASGAIVETPLEEEAGALGAALQALFLDEQQRGASPSFAAIAERCVKLSDQPTHPQVGVDYSRARTRYRDELQRLYGVAPAKRFC